MDAYECLCVCASVEAIKGRSKFLIYDCGGKVANVTCDILGLDEGLPEDSPLMSSGLTSNSAVLLRNKLAEELPGISLPFTLVFDYPTIGSIADYIADQAGG